MADYGPDAGSVSATRGPNGRVEWNVLAEPGNYGLDEGSDGICDGCDRLRFQPDPSIDPSLSEPLLAGQARMAG